MSRAACGVDAAGPSRRSGPRPCGCGVRETRLGPRGGRGRVRPAGLGSSRLQRTRRGGGGIGAGALGPVVSVLLQIRPAKEVFFENPVFKCIHEELCPAEDLQRLHPTPVSSACLQPELSGSGDLGQAGVNVQRASAARPHFLTVSLGNLEHFKKKFSSQFVLSNRFALLSLRTSSVIKASVKSVD